MYRADFESTVETLAEVLSALLAELPGALPEWHCRASLLIAESLWTQQGCPQFPARIVHQGVTVSSSFEHAGFDTTRAVGDFVGGDALQGQTPQLPHIPARPRRQ